VAGWSRSGILNVPVSELSDQELECVLARWRQWDFMQVGGWALGLPVGVLLFGCMIGWIGRGFRSSQVK
jgi:hypothetical protein